MFEKKQDEVQLFEELIAPVYDYIYRVIYCIVNNKTLADDAMQNTLFAAYSRLSTLRDKTKFKPWIHSIAKNESLKLLKARNRELSVEPVNLSTFTGDCYNIPDTYILEKEKHSVLIECINQLHEDERKILALRYYGGLSLVEISRVLNIKLNTVKSKHKRIKKKLYDKLIDTDIIMDFNDGGGNDEKQQNG